MIILCRVSVAQHGVHTVPCGHGLRAREFEDQSAIKSEQSARRHVDAEIVAPIDPNRIERVPEHLMGDDSGTAAGELGLCPLVDIDLPAAAAKQQGCEQP